MRETIGFIGLGNLGLPIASNLLDAGHALRVYNRTARKAEPLIARGAHLAKTPAEAARGTGSDGRGLVASIVWDDASLEEVVTGEGFLDALGPGGVHVSMTTVSPDAARRVAALHAKHGSRYVEAPIFGRPEAATAKQLLMPITGLAEAKARVRPVLEAMGATGIHDFGEEPGQAVTVKLAGNFLIIAAGGALREAIGFADKSGVDPGPMIEMLTSTLFSAPVYKSYGKLAVENLEAQRRGETRVVGSNGRIPNKDIGIFQRQAATVGASTPLAETIGQLLEAPR